MSARICSSRPLFLSMMLPISIASSTDSLPRQLNAPIASASFRRVVFCLRLGGTKASGAQPVCVDGIALDECRFYGRGSSARELQIRRIVADAVGMAPDAELPARIFF